MKPIISVEGLGKKYTIRHEGQGRYRALREEIFKLPQRLFQRKHQDKEEFWALKDVSFDIMPGDRVGIIGRNGAGKSTLLKLLSRITEPSTGKITLRGRIASLLEVGTGFHPELTGRENIFLNGAILGMSRAEVRRKFDEIVDFAGVEKFLDTPVKRYSSGMYVRLAFAVAAHLEPEILIVDEVLAVGDAEFQKKCLGKMEQVGQDGRTVLFISHNMAAIQRLCEKTIYLSQGKIKLKDDSYRCIKRYLLENSETGRVINFNNSNSNISIIELSFIDQQGEVITRPINRTSQVFIKLKFELKELCNGLTIGYALYNECGEELFWSYQTDPPKYLWPKIKKGINEIITCVPTASLNEGTYYAQCIGGIHNKEWYYPPRSGDMISIHLLGDFTESPYWTSRRPGLIAPKTFWKEL